MTHGRALTASAILCVISASVAAQLTTPHRDGTIVERTPCNPPPSLTYAHYVSSAEQRQAEEVEAAKREGIVVRAAAVYLSRDAFDRREATSRDVECTRIVYMSDGLRVVGFTWRPRDQRTERLPLIIFNRGGNGEFAKVGPCHTFHRLAAEGFVVIASQYRGSDGGEGRDEFGGADIRDVLHLMPVAESLGNVDVTNVFMLGWSRGAMTTLLAVKQGIRVNAVAIGGGLLDLFAELRRRPETAMRVWGELMPGFNTRRDEILRDRSAIYWPERITVPVLIVHGGADWRVSPATSLSFAQKLQETSNSYELIIYAGDDHAVTANQLDRDRRIVEWFKKHRN